MYARIISIVVFCFAGFGLYAQQIDSSNVKILPDVIINAPSYEEEIKRTSSLPVDVAEKKFLNEHFTGNLVQALEYIPGVQSMDIGSGFSKPMIRGMSFNRITVVENGIKQEGQQWGSDHGLEIDAFNIERVSIYKGSSSLLYGSDAMGGVIEISQALPPLENQFFGEVALLGKTVNGTLGGSLLLGVKKGAWYVRLRYSEQHFGDYRVPTDTIVYLTQKIPVYGRKLKNTAGMERNANFYTEYRKGKYFSHYAINNAYQTVGFFPGAHGIPDISRVQDDGKSYNIELPYSIVNHLKVSTHQQYAWEKLMFSWDIGYQNNYREEQSEFHTHYSSQSPPETNPDRELLFKLNTYSSSVKFKFLSSTVWEYTAGWDFQYQQNRIGGYSFLLPNYDRFNTGIFVIASWKKSAKFALNGGLRYDFGMIDADAYEDPYLETHLRNMGYDDELIAQYQWRSYPVKRNFGDVSGSLGMVWNMKTNHLLKVNIGRSFRLPGANELASNGVHHGTFRHEQGDSSLASEKGWQLDVSYLFERKKIQLSLTPFVSWFSNYIHLSPTGEWSVLPHAGQIYQYIGTQAIFAGTELAFDMDILSWLHYSFSGEYVYTYNIDEQTPLSFSPPASMRNTVTFKVWKFELFAELHTIASQNRVAKNESPTKGTNLINLGGNISIPVAKTTIDIQFSLNNLLNTKYYNHLSFYRKVEIPEPGRNFQLLIKVPFKIKLK